MSFMIRTPQQILSRW